MASRQGPVTDENGTYYVVTEDDGSTHKEYVNPSSDATTTTISANGDVVQPQAGSATPHVAVAPAPGELDSVGGVDPTDDVDAAYGGKSGSSSGRSYRSGGYSDGGGSSYGSDNYPTYANGQLHPAWGGPPLVPGGAAAAAAMADGTSTGQRQVYVPGGAAAGPQSTRGAYSPDTPAYGGGGPSLGAGEASGGGGHTSAAYDALRAKGEAMAGKVRSMGAGGGSSSSSYDDGYNAAAARREQRRIGNAYDKYNEALAEPNYLPVRGVLKREGVKKEGAMGILGHPEMLLRGMGELIDPNSPSDAILQRLPATDLALLSAGTQGRKLMSRTPVDRVPGILRKQGVKPTKPDYKRTLDPSKVANQIAAIYQLYGQGQRPDTETLLGNLATLKRKSAVGQGLEQQYLEDPNAAVDSVRNYLQSAVLGTQPDDMFADVQQRSIDARLANMGTTLLNRKPKKFSRGVREVARGLL